MVSAASLKVMDFYDDMRRFKFILDVFICYFIVVVVFVHIVVALFSMVIWLAAHVVQVWFVFMACHKHLFIKRLCLRLMWYFSHIPLYLNVFWIIYLLGR